MVSKEFAVGLVGFPLCFLNLTVRIFLGGASMEAAPPPHSPVAVLPVFTPMIRMQIIAKFLGALSPPRTVASCTAQDIVKFVISKDKWGRTLAHSLSCSKRDCSCQKRLAAGSVDSTLGHLRAIFNNLGALMTPTLLPKP